MTLGGIGYRATLATPRIPGLGAVLGSNEEVVEVNRDNCLSGVYNLVTVCAKLSFNCESVVAVVVNEYPLRGNFVVSTALTTLNGEVLLGILSHVFVSLFLRREECNECDVGKVSVAVCDGCIVVVKSDRLKTNGRIVD